MEYRLTYHEFYEALKKNRLLALKCKQCGAYTVPPKAVCMECTSQDLEVTELSGNGKIKSFTVIHVPPIGFEAPYIVALIELNEGPWVMGNIVGTDPANLTMDIINKSVKIGHKISDDDMFSAGKRVAMAFSLES
jgi:uncharacterized OB-fold protein